MRISPTLIAAAGEFARRIQKRERLRVSRFFYSGRFDIEKRWNFHQQFEKQPVPKVF
jgi:hypothetical protein